MKFEHQIVYFSWREEQFFEELNEKCSDGWKIVGTFSATDNNYFNSVLLQREIPPSAAALSIVPKSAAA